MRTLAPPNLAQRQAVVSPDPPLDAEIPGATLFGRAGPSVVDAHTAQPFAIFESVHRNAIPVGEAYSGVCPHALVLARLCLRPTRRVARSFMLGLDHRHRDSTPRQGAPLRGAAT